MPKRQTFTICTPEVKFPSGFRQFVPFPPSLVTTLHFDGFDLTHIIACAVKGAGLQRVQLPPGNWIAPPGSNRNGGRGNDAVGAFDGKDR
jgi:hypothetical protein